MKMFQKNLMASEDVRAYLGTGMFYDNGEKAECADGMLVEIGDLEDHSVYAGIKDHNTRKITYPTAATTNYGIVDYVGRSGGEINGVYYKEGIMTAGLTAPAGTPVRYRKLKVGDTFYLTTDNFDTAPTVGTSYAVPTAGDGIWTVQGNIGTGLCIKIEDQKALTEGATDTDIQYFCTVVGE